MKRRFHVVQGNATDTLTVQGIGAGHNTAAKDYVTIHMPGYLRESVQYSHTLHPRTLVFYVTNAAGTQSTKIFVTEE